MKVAIITGGDSYERVVSLRSAAAVKQAVDELGHEGVVLDSGPSTTRDLTDGGFDVAFIALLGRGGQDGHVQSLLDLLGIPYTGPRPGPAQAAFEKSRAKRMLIAAGVPTPQFVSLTSTALQEFGAGDALAEAGESLGFPVVVKPVSCGSALGVRIARNALELPRALVHAMSYDGHVLVEQYVPGRELAVCTYGTEPLVVLPPVRIVPRQADHFDFESRYTHGQTEFCCPPEDVSGAELARVEEVARAAVEALDLSGYARVDMIVDDAGEPQVLELEGVPALTDTSLLPMAARAAGLTVAQVVDALLADALAQEPSTAVRAD